MNFIEELKWRGMLNDMTPEAAEELEKGMATGYIGFDPTAPNLTIGNYVQIMLLKLFQLSGHKPIVLMGGATGRIGDPSFKEEERALKTYEELDANLARQAKMFSKFLDFDHPENGAVIVNNIDFYKDMNVLDFLRDVGKNLTINYMTSKESVKKRLETGLSFTEFSYQLLQAYDFQRLYTDRNCKFQMGGSDQWGNITSGTEFIRRAGGKAFAITTPLLTKADGSKFGKSEQGNIWLAAEGTSPYRFYQFWVDCDDRDLPKYIRYFTLKSQAEVEALEAEYADNPNGLKRILAEELTVRVHSQEAFEAAKKVSELLFAKKAQAVLLSMDAATLGVVAKEIPSFTIPKSALSEALSIVDLLVEHTDILKSKGEARRAIKNNAISVNKAKINDAALNLTSSDLLHDQYIMIENGKRNKYMIIAE